MGQQNAKYPARKKVQTPIGKMRWQRVSADIKVDARFSMNDIYISDELLVKYQKEIADEREKR